MNLFVARGGPPRFSCASLDSPLTLQNKLKNCTSEREKNHSGTKLNTPLPSQLNHAVGRARNGHQTKLSHRRLPMPHGQVTEEDFIEHHANLSFGVKSDSDFRELVMNCWGLAGGGGGGDDGDSHLSADVADVLRRANAPRRNFLVSYADGSQCVENLPFSTAVSSASLPRYRAFAHGCGASLRPCTR